METTLNQSDVVYGIIHTKELKDLPKKGIRFNIVCGKESISVKIPETSSYISGLTNFHRKHNAIVGTRISLTKIEIEKDTYELKYYSHYKDEKSVSGDTLSKIIYKMQSRPWMFDETTVRCEIIDPILKMAGWEFPDITREVGVRIPEKTTKADYLLYKDNNPCIIIEAKKLLDDLHNNKQLNDYWKSNNITNIKEALGIFTNGQEWQLWKCENNTPVCIACIDIFKNDDFTKFIWEILRKEVFKPDCDKIIKEAGIGNEMFSKERNKSIVSDFEDIDFPKFVEKHKDNVREMINNGQISKLIIASGKKEIKRMRGNYNKTYTQQICDNIWQYTYISPYEKALIMMQVIYTNHLESIYIK